MADDDYTNEDILWAVEQSMIDHGFRKIHKDAEYGGVVFRVLGEARAGLVMQTMLVTWMPVLGEKEAARIEDEFIRVDKASKSLWFGKIFMLCVFADKIDENVGANLVERIRKNAMKVSNLSKGGGGGIAMYGLSKVEEAGVFYPRAVGWNAIVEIIGDALEGLEPEPEDTDTEVMQ
jgi:hypothetical protein